MHPLRELTDLIAPPACLLCSAPLLPAAAVPSSAPGDAPVCGGCRARLMANRPPACQRCGLPIRASFDAVVTCRLCEETPPAFDAARAPWRYSGAARQAIRSFKFRRRWRIGRWLARHMAACAASTLPLAEVDAVVPVPMHRLKRWLHGYDPACELSRRLAQLLEKPHVPSALHRARWTRPQARLAWRARRANVRRAFRADPGAVRGRRVLLVDDVLTSRATADACAEALKRSGASRVYVLTAARTPLTRAAP